MVEANQYTKRKRRIAIVGSGLAGLTAAHLLSTPAPLGEEDGDGSFEVDIFERSQRIGYEAASIQVTGDDGRTYTVDSPMRAVQGGYYEHLLKLYKKLGIELQRTNFDYSFFKLAARPVPEACQDTCRAFSASALQSKEKIPEDTSETCNGRTGPDTPYQATSFIYNGGNGLSFRPFSFPHRLQASNWLDLIQTFLRVLLFACAYVWLLLLCAYHSSFSHLSITSPHWLARATFAEFLSYSRLPAAFVEDILIPLFACVATCTPAQVLEYPAADFLTYIVKTFGTDHYTVKGGVRNAVHKLLANVDAKEHIHLGCELVSIKRSLSQSGTLELEDSDGNVRHFEHVIFATQANHARALLRTYYKSLQDEPERDASLLAYEKRRMEGLSLFQYTHSVVVNHYDGESTLASNASDRRMLNIASWSARPEAQKEGAGMDGSKQVTEDYIMATHDLSSLHPALRSKAGEAMLQTTNPSVDIRDDKIISKKVFERAIVTRESRSAILPFLADGERGCGENYQGAQGIWFVGAWAGEGIPLLEGCVVSAERVVRGIRSAR